MYIPYTIAAIALTSNDVVAILLLLPKLVFVFIFIILPMVVMMILCYYCRNRSRSRSRSSSGRGGVVVENCRRVMKKVIVCLFVCFCGWLLASSTLYQKDVCGDICR